VDGRDKPGHDKLLARRHRLGKAARYSPLNQL
jgi:hypothetical protein